MDELWTRIVEDAVARVSGPMKFRLLLQPLMASILAIRSGLRDARTGRPPYFWALLTEPTQRRAMLRDGWKSVSKVFLVAMTLDVVYQLVATRRVFPGEVVLTAIVLAIVPYLILRGLTTRLMSMGKPRAGRESPPAPVGGRGASSSGLSHGPIPRADRPRQSPR